MIHSLNRSRALELTLMVLLSGLFACAFGEIRPNDPMDRQASLEKQHTHYTDLVRWSQFEEAATYVEPADRNGFIRQMPEFDEVRFTDWKADTWEFEDPETLDRAVIDVTYRGYSLYTPFEVKIHETQEWTRSGRSNSWKVVSHFKDLGRLAEK
ncbi:MAG: hypothetical protein CL917_05550 [Deltaproteobacteria bacterium]|jgi:hypothetical protein|nr:hypothetical protein [Deltaproteobacteria bacterium]